MFIIRHFGNFKKKPHICHPSTHPKASGIIVEEGSEKRQEPRVKRTRANSAFAMWKGPLYSWTQSSYGCLNKTCIRSSQPTFQHGLGRANQPSFLAELLLTVDRQPVDRKSPFALRVWLLIRHSTLLWMILYSQVYGQHKWAITTTTMTTKTTTTSKNEVKKSRGDRRGGASGRGQEKE